jgi:hypothetical protein
MLCFVIWQLVPFYHHLVLLVSRLARSLTLGIDRVMYIIDDANSTIQYFTGPTGIPWNHKVPGMANNTADATKCYDQT